MKKKVLAAALAAVMTMGILAGCGSSSGSSSSAASPAANSTAYWLFNTAFPLVDVAFLGGRQEPVIETANADFNQLGIQMRCYFDYGASKGETKAALYSTGA